MVIALPRYFVCRLAGGDIRVVSIEQGQSGRSEHRRKRISNGDSDRWHGYRMREGYIAFSADDGTGLSGRCHGGGICSVASRRHIRTKT